MKTLSTFDLAPGKNNPRNSEGDFLRLKDGSIAFVYSRFTKGSADDAESEIALIISKDNGLSWGEQKILFRTSDFENAENIMSVSLLRMKDGAAGLFFLIRYDLTDSRLYLFRSYDELNTFSEPVCCVPHVGYFVTNNNRVIRTSDGRLIVPGNYHPFDLSIGDKRNLSGFNSHGTGYYFYSDDDGKTWKESTGKSVLPFRASKTGLQETGVIELAENKLLAYFRTDIGMQYSSFSYDNGETWSKVEPMLNFTSPISPMKIEKLDDGRYISVWNPVPFYNGRNCDWNTVRNPLAVAFSDNGEDNWSAPEIIESTPDTGYSYPAVFNEGNLLILGYCAGTNEDGGNLNRLRIRTIEL